MEWGISRREGEKQIKTVLDRVYTRIGNGIG